MDKRLYTCKWIEKFTDAYNKLCCGINYILKIYRRSDSSLNLMTDAWESR